MVAGLLDDNTPFLSGMDLIGAPVFTKVRTCRGDVDDVIGSGQSMSVEVVSIAALY